MQSASTQNTPTQLARRTVEVFLFPAPVTVEVAKRDSPELFRVLKDQGVEVVPMEWNGRIESLPTDRPVIIRASAQSEHNWVPLGDFCGEHGHLCFYNNKWIRPDGRAACPPVHLAARTREFLSRGQIQAAKLTIEIFYGQAHTPVSPGFVRLDNQHLFRFLDQRGVTIQFHEWDDQIEILPTDRPVMIVPQIALKGSDYWRQLGTFCQTYHHLSVVNNQFIDPLGAFQNEDHLFRQANSFLMRAVEKAARQ